MTACPATYQTEPEEWGPSAGVSWCFECDRPAGHKGPHKATMHGLHCEWGPRCVFIGGGEGDVPA